MLSQREDARSSCEKDPESCDQLEVILRGLVGQSLKDGKKREAVRFCKELVDLRSRHPGLKHPFRNANHGKRHGAGKVAGVGDRADVYFHAGKIAAVYDHRIEFYEPPKGVSLYFVERDCLRRLGETFPSSGRIIFLDDGDVEVIGGNAFFKTYAFAQSPFVGSPPARDRRESTKPKEILTFAEKIGRAPPMPGSRTRFFVCTDPWLDDDLKAGNFESFCGMIDVSGKVVFQIPEERGRRRMIEPLGMAEDGSEALFAINEESHGTKARVLKEYLLWRASSGLATVPIHPTTAELQAVLKKYIPQYIFYE